MALLEPEATPPSSDLAKPKIIAAARQCLEPLLGSEVCTHAADCGCTRADILPPIPLARAAGDLTRVARDGFLNCSRIRLRSQLWLRASHPPDLRVLMWVGRW